MDDPAVQLNVPVNEAVTSCLSVALRTRCDPTPLDDRSTCDEGPWFFPECVRGSSICCVIAPKRRTDHNAARTQEAHMGGAPHCFRFFPYDPSDKTSNALLYIVCLSPEKMSIGIHAPASAVICLQGHGDRDLLS